MVIEFRSPSTRRRSETGSVWRRAAISVAAAPIEVSFRGNDGASSSRMIRSISAKPALRSVAVSNGTAPISSSYKSTPSEYTSEASSMSPVIVSACSGLAYSGVPTIWPNCVSSVFSTAHLSVAFAMPKSITLGTGVPSCSVTSTFEGFRSRWITPFLVRMLDRTADREE